MCSMTVAWTRTVPLGRIGLPRRVYVREPASDMAEKEMTSPTATSFMRGTVRMSREERMDLRPSRFAIT